MTEHNDSYRELNTAQEWLRDARRVVIFTGAGISAASGIATFRDAGGFWTRFPPEDFANWTGLLQTATLQPARFAEFLVAVLEPIATAQPNAAHAEIAQLQENRELVVVTQNIDGLHSDAGNDTVYEVHGTVFEIVEMLSGKVVRRLSRDDLTEIVEQIKAIKGRGWTAPALLAAVKPLMGFSFAGAHRPNLVLFGDQLAEPAWSEATRAVRNCDLLVSVGTSQAVFPAASLPREAQENGAKVLTIDPEVGGGDLWLRGRAEEILPQLTAEL